MKIRNTLRLASVFLLFLVGAAPALAQDGPLEGLDSYIADAIDAWEIPGLAIAVVKGDSIVFAEGYGVRELGESEEVNPRTLFAIGSSSKAFTAAALAMLVDAGKIEWEDPATKYLPQFQLHDPWVTRELTVRDLLTHNSGLSRGDLMWYATEYDRAEILRRVRFLEPTWSFRSHFGYQNIMYLAAGQVTPAVTGMSWDEFVDARIFSPLGMDVSNTSTLALRDRDNVAQPHEEIEDEVRPIPYRNIDNIAPAGAINSNVLEMAQWVRLQLGRGIFQGDTLISPEVFQAMHTPQTIMPKEGGWELMAPTAHFISYGMGWILSDYRDRKMVQHGGNIDGMHALVGMIPEEDVGLVVLTNKGSNLLTYALMHRVFDAFLGAPETDWSARMLAKADSMEAEAEARREARLAKRVEGTSPSLPLVEYAGTYEDEMFGDVTVRLEDDQLVLSKNPAWVGQLEHWHYDTFRVDWTDPALGRTFVTFGLNVDGQVEDLVLENMASYERVSDAESIQAASLP